MISSRIKSGCSWRATKSAAPYSSSASHSWFILLRLFTGRLKTQPQRLEGTQQAQLENRHCFCSRSLGVFTARFKRLLDSDLRTSQTLLANAPVFVESTPIIGRTFCERFAEMLGSCEESGRNSPVRQDRSLPLYWGSKRKSPGFTGHPQPKRRTSSCDRSVQLLPFCFCSE